MAGEDPHAAELERLTALLCEAQKMLALRPGEPQHVQTILCGLAHRMAQQGRGEEAEVRYRESLALGSVHMGTVRPARPWILRPLSRPREGRGACPLRTPACARALAHARRAVTRSWRARAARACLCACLPHAQLVNYACFLDQRGRREEACALYQKALAVDPAHPAALSNYAHNLCKAGDYGRAEALLKRAVKRCPSDVTVLHNYGCLLWEGKRDFKRAEEVLNQVIKLDPGHQESVQALAELRVERARAEQEAVLHARALLAELEVDDGAGGEDVAAMLDSADKKRRRRRKKKGAQGEKDAGEGAGGQGGAGEAQGSDELGEAEGPDELRDACSEAATRVPESPQDALRHRSAAAVGDDDAAGGNQLLPASVHAPGASCAAATSTPAANVNAGGEHRPAQAHSPAAAHAQAGASSRESGAEHTSAQHGHAAADCRQDSDSDKAAARAASHTAPPAGAAAAEAAAEPACHRAQLASPPARPPTQLPPQLPPRSPAAMRSWLTMMRAQVEDDGATQRKQEDAEHEMHIIDDHGIMHVLRVGRKHPCSAPPLSFPLLPQWLGAR